MKKLLLFIVGLIGFVSIGVGAGRERDAVADIGPTFVDQVAESISIATPTSSENYNCLDYIMSYSTSAYTLRILNIETTFYQFVLLATTSYNASFDPPLCGDKGAKLTIKSSSTVNGAFNQINYRGFIGR